MTRRLTAACGLLALAVTACTGGGTAHGTPSHGKIIVRAAGVVEQPQPAELVLSAGRSSAQYRITAASPAAMHRGQRSAMMISGVPPSALSDLHPAVRVAGPARPLARLQERAVAGAAAPGRRAAPHQCGAWLGLGRPRCARRADRPPAAKAADAPAGHPRAPSCGGTAAWAPGSGPARTGQAGRRPAPRSQRSSSGSPPRTTAGAASGSTANCLSSATESARPRSGESSKR
jgi:hypothetical protein